MFADKYSARPSPARFLREFMARQISVSYIWLIINYNYYYNCSQEVLSHAE